MITLAAFGRESSVQPHEEPLESVGSDWPEVGLDPDHLFRSLVSLQPSSDAFTGCRCIPPRMLLSGAHSIGAAPWRSGLVLIPRHSARTPPSPQPLAPPTSNSDKRGTTASPTGRGHLARDPIAALLVLPWYCSQEDKPFHCSSPDTTAVPSVAFPEQLRSFPVCRVRACGSIRAPVSPPPVLRSRDTHLRRAAGRLAGRPSPERPALRSDLLHTALACCVSWSA